MKIQTTLPIIACLIVVTCPSRAANVAIDMLDFSFSPKTKTVNVGDTVTWVNTGISHHTATATDGGGFNSGTLSKNQSFSFTFTKAGSFSYICELHQSRGMTGAITVQSATAPPAVSIIAPHTGDTFNNRDTVTITADASATAPATVVKVEFFDGANLIGRATTSPFSINFQFQPGNPVLSAKVTDSGGATGMSNDVGITVDLVSENPPNISITSPNVTGILEAPANLMLQANATDSEGFVVSVEYFDSVNGDAATSLGSAFTTPYSLNATLQAGKHTITAIATDNDGAAITSAPLNLTVSVRPNLVIKKTSDTTCAIAASGTAGVTFTLQGTPTLPTGWADITSLTASPDSTVTFTDIVPAQQAFKFYRIIIK